jgi:SM-20-related protein
MLGTKIQVFVGLYFSEKHIVFPRIFANFFYLLKVMEKQLFEQIDTTLNPTYEAIITNLLEQQYSIVDGFFTEAEVQLLRNSLLAKYEADRFKKSAIGNRTNEEIDRSIRGDFILWIDEHQKNEAETAFFSKINELVAYLNKTCFLGILQKEFHYAVYPKGTFYKRHIDTFQNDDRRKLSIVCYLNEENWPAENGGELALYPEHRPKVEVLPLPGRVVLFESQILEHEVKTVNAGERFSITGWLKTR